MRGHKIILGKRRDAAHSLIESAPEGSMMTIDPPHRTIPQNALLWVILSDVSRAKPEGRRLTPDVWKALFMHSLDHATRFEMALDGNGMVPVGFRSSRLTKDQMSDLIEEIFRYGSEHGVVWSEPGEQTSIAA